MPAEHVSSGKGYVAVVFVELASCRDQEVPVERPGETTEETETQRHEREEIDDGVEKIGREAHRETK
jgi:hypothetical protein